MIFGGSNVAEERPIYSDDFKRSAIDSALHDMSPFPQIEDKLGIRRGLLIQWILQTELSADESNSAFDELGKMRLEIEGIRLESELLSAMAGYTADKRPPTTDE